MEPIIERYVREHLDPSCNSEANFAKHDSQCKKPGIDGTTGTLNQIFLRQEYRGVPLGGHPDGVGDTILWEFKAPTMYKTDRITTDNDTIYLDDIFRSGLPLPWVIQTQHYMMLTGLQRGAVAVWNYDRWCPHVFYMNAHEGLHARLKDEYVDFWFYVESEMPPSATTVAMLESVEVISDVELDDILEAYDRAKRMRYDGKDLQRELKAKILTYAGDRKTIQTENYLATLSEIDGKYSTYTRITVKDKSE